MGIEPTSSAWKAEVLPLNHTRNTSYSYHTCCDGMVEGEGFEPSKAEPADLQSAPFDHSGTPPCLEGRYSSLTAAACQQIKAIIL